jgi:hypothetical protein
MNRPRSLAAFHRPTDLPRPHRPGRSHGCAIVLAAFLSLGTSFAVADPCPLGPLERELVVEVLENALRDAFFVADESDEFPVRLRAFALSLIGSDEGSRGALEVACPGPQDFEPVCSFPPFEDPVPEFWETRDRCVQRSCFSENSDSIAVYLTVRPRTSPDDEHPFGYASDEFASEIVYDPNPRITWSFETDFSFEPFRTIAVATASHRVTVLRDGQAPIPLDHDLTLRVSGVADVEVFFARLEVVFPGLGKGKKPVRAVVTIDDLGVTEGSITLGKKTLATIGGQFSGDGFEELVWEKGCGKNNLFLRGDVTGGGNRNAGDLNLLAAHLLRRAPLPCEDSADVDDNGTVDAADLVYLTSWLLHDGEPPLPPFDLRGPDPTDDGLNCAW